ncbi:hypothetical protein A2U01_0035676 [Trifolium medium]|uniref:Uncharacterized protein n=1 Tax=Trifolium medium TaxID=97028 RepID=A0A392PRT4_9FABA|nr:hypothetical protein [Trifolium medium]
MVSFAERMLKLAADDKVTKKVKKNKGRTALVLDQSKSAPGSSSSPGGHVCSSQAGAQVSPSVVKEPPPKRQREDDLADLTAPEKPFLLPRCFSARGFLEKHPPMVADVERSAILTMEPAVRLNLLMNDTAAVMRMLETALVLSDEKGVTP